MDTGVYEPSQGESVLKQLGRTDSRVSNYRDSIQQEIDSNNKEIARLEQQEAAERAKGDEIQNATKVAQTLLKELFPNISTEHGDDDKIRVITDHMVHELTLRREDEMRRALNRLIQDSPKRYHGVDGLYSMVGGHHER